MILVPRLTRSLEDQTCALYAAPQKDPEKGTEKNHRKQGFCEHGLIYKTANTRQKGKAWE